MTVRYGRRRGSQGRAYKYCTHIALTAFGIGRDLRCEQLEAEQRHSTGTIQT